MKIRSCWTLAVVLMALALGLPSIGAAQKLPQTSGLYAGTQKVRGLLKLPVLGEVDTQVTFKVLARIEREGETVRIEQRPCAVRFTKVLGIGTRFDDEKVQNLPVERIVYQPASRGEWLQAKPWWVGWGKEDADGDGAPGATVHVEAPLCGGSLQVTSETVSVARGRWQGERFEGQMKVVVAQGILGASNACLELTATDRKQKMSGDFVYRPIEEGATCEQVLAAP